MAIGFPSSGGDSSTANSASPLVLVPPANVANGDLLIAWAISRSGWSAEPSGLPLLAEFTTNGTFSVYALAVPSVGSLPSSWTWTPASSRCAVVMIRVTGADMTTPVPQVGVTAGAGSDGGLGAGSGTFLPLVLPGVTMAGGAVAMVGTYFTGDGNAPSADFVPGFTLQASLTTPTAGAGRSAMGLYVITGTGATGNVTTANDWPGSPTGQDGVMIAIQAASAPAALPPTGISRRVHDPGLRARRGSFFQPPPPIVTPLTPVTLLNSFEEGSNGTSVSAANSGGSGSNAFDVVSFGNGTLAYSSTQAAHGSLSALFINGTSTSTQVEWNGSLGTQPQLYGRFYLYVNAYPAATTSIAFLLNGSVTLSRISLTSTGILRGADSPNSVWVSFTNVIPLNQWVRVEWFMTFPGTNNASADIKLFLQPDSSTPTEEHTASGLNLGSLPVSSARFGWNSTIGSSSAYFDELGVSTVTWLGPAVPPSQLQTRQASFSPKWAPSRRLIAGRVSQPVPPLPPVDAGSASFSAASSLTASAFVNPQLAFRSAPAGSRPRWTARAPRGRVFQPAAVRVQATASFTAASSLTATAFVNPQLAHSARQAGSRPRWAARAPRGRVFQPVNVRDLGTASFSAASSMTVTGAVNPQLAFRTARRPSPWGAVSRGRRAGQQSLVLSAGSQAAAASFSAASSMTVTAAVSTPAPLFLRGATRPARRVPHLHRAHLAMPVPPQGPLGVKAPLWVRQSGGRPKAGPWVRLGRGRLALPGWGQAQLGPTISGAASLSAASSMTVAAKSGPDLNALWAEYLAIASTTDADRRLWRTVRGSIDEETYQFEAYYSADQAKDAAYKRWLDAYNGWLK